MLIAYVVGMLHKIQDTILIWEYIASTEAFPNVRKYFVIHKYTGKFVD